MVRKVTILNTFKVLLALTAFIFVTFFTIQNWENIRGSFSKIEIHEGLILLLLVYIQYKLRVVKDYLIYRNINKDITIKELFNLYVIQNLLNYIPLKPGTFVLLQRLNKKYNIKIKDLVFFFTYQNYILTSIVFILLGMCFLFSNQITNYKFAGIVMIMTPVMIYLFFSKIEKSKLINLRLINKLFSFVQNKKNQVLTKKVQYLFFLLSLLCFVCSVLRYHLILIYFFDFDSISFSLILGSVTHLSIFLSITPSSLGIREILIMSLSKVTDFSASFGFITSIIDRFLVVIFCVLSMFLCSLCSFVCKRKLHQ